MALAVLALTMAPPVFAASEAFNTPSAAVASYWVELSLPALSSLRGASAAEIDAARRRITEQQDEALSQLRALGAEEQARVNVLRNALAVRMPADRLDAARRVPGVRSVRVVRHAELQQPPS